MSGKKNIDRLFQEKFKEFEVSPDKSIWSRIEDELDSKKKKEKRVLPIWWKLSGAAAILALLIAIGYSTYRNGNKDNENKIITNIQPNHPEEKLEDNTNIVQNTPETELENNNGAKNSVSDSVLVKINETFVKNSPNKAIIASKTKDHEKIKSNLSPNKNNNMDPITNVRHSINKNEKNATNKTNAVVANNASEKEKDLNQVSNNPYSQDNEKSIESEIKNEKNANGKNILPSVKEEVIVKNEENTGGKKSLLDVVKKQQKEKEEEVAETYENRWSINPNVAPVYYNTIGNGSPINSQFSDNNKEGDVNMSYGINVAYQLNDKLSIRSGINKVNFGYNTQDIAFTSSTQGAAIQNVNYGARASNIKVIDNLANNAQQPSQDSFISQEVLALNDVGSFEGSMNQQFGYLEVPLELKYRVLDKKLGVNIIGGISSLFLTKNQITVESSSLVTEIGKANNLNNTNFSTNIGIGFDYKFNKVIQFNIEPMFKYQLNAFSNSAGGFKPYSVGVYTGLSFKF